MQRRYRLKKSAEFQRVRAQKRSWAHPLLVLYVAPNGLDWIRVGISTSRRLGKAVARNRVKRLVREAVRGLIPSITPGSDLVFAARGPAAEATYEQVRQAVDGLLRRARLIASPRPVPRTESGHDRNEVDSAAADKGVSAYPLAHPADGLSV
ncbi:MAG TPA: ribonuclease P protein component [Chloroflexota bacterium]